MSILEGIRILDLTHAMAGPFATMWLGDMGAEIIKIERPGQGDPTRAYGPFVNGESTYFATLNRNKKYVSIDLKKEEGRNLLLRLVEKSDVILNNFRPGVMKKLGLDYETVRAANPKIVYACISGFGQEGPYAERPCYDIVGQAMGGIMSITGWPDGEPDRVGASIGDAVAGMTACVGILSALFDARKTGEGQIVDVSLVDSVVALALQDYSCWFGGGDSPARMGNQYRAWVPYGTYKAKDRYYIIGAGTDQQFRRFSEQVIKMPELCEDARFADTPSRVRNRTVLDKIINDWAAEKKAEDICAALRAADVPFGMINDISMIEASPQTAARRMIVTEDHPVIGKLKMINCPIRFPGIDEQDSPNPTRDIGADNEAVLSMILGLSNEDAVSYVRQGILYEQ